MKIWLEDRVKRLSRHLEADLLRFSGKASACVPRFRSQQLLPLAVIVAAAVVLACSGKARRSLLLKFAVLFSTRVLQEQLRGKLQGGSHDDEFET